ncbi:MAG: tetratricopeptide repeat protein [Bacteroidales bacterium]|jgi:signal transduction histidine kinase|nr:tetratricopeptide repeat protein [Bacteroidales bacterium]
MIKRIITSFLIVFAFLNAHADDISNIEKGNTNASMLLKRASEFKNTNIDSAIFYSNLALTYADNNFELTASMKSHLLLGELLANKGYSQDAIRHLNSAFNIANTQQDFETICYYYINKASIFANNGLYQEGIEMLNLALQEEKRCDKLIIRAEIYNGFGSIYYTLENYSKAQEFFYKALYIYQTINDKNELASSYNNLGIILSAQNEPKKALNSYIKGLEYAEKTNNQNLIGKFHNNIGLSYQKLYDFDNALNHYLLSIKIKKKSGNLISLAASLTNLGDFYIIKGETDKALDVLNQGINIYINAGYTSNISHLYYQIGYVHYLIGDMSEAIDNLEKSLTLATSINFWPAIEESATLLASIKKDFGKYKQALKLTELKNEAQDSLKYVEQKNTLLRLQMQHEISKLQKEQDLETSRRDVIEAKKDNQLKQIRNISIAGFIILLIIIVFLNRYSSHKQRSNNLLKEQNTKISRQKERIEIQKQILEKQNQQLHDTFENVKYLSEIGQRITSHLSFNEIVQEVYNNTQFINKDTYLLIGINRSSSDSLTYSGIKPGSDKFINDFTSLNKIESVYEHSFVFEESIFTGYLQGDTKKDYFNRNYFEIKENIQSIICIPLVVKKRKIGVIMVGRKSKNAFIQMHLDILKTLGSYIAVALENTEAYSKIEEQTSELLKLNNTKDLMFSIIGHDLRSPVGNMETMLELIEENLSSYDYNNANYLLSITKGAARSAYNLLENLLYWAKAQKGEISYEPKLFNLSRKINEVVSLFDTTSQNKHIKISANIPSKIMVSADENLIYTVLRNLVSNAIKFTPEDGSIEILGEMSKENVIVSIKDSGVGISEENMKKIFDKHEHFTTYGTNNEKGTGLGLSICNTFINKHNGNLSVKSSPNKGSTFSFTLPLKKVEIAN